MILPILIENTKLLPFYVIRMGFKESQRDIVRPKGFPGYQILYCTGGSGIFKSEGKEYKIDKGDAFFFRPDIPHEYHPVDKPWQTKWITFSGSAAKNVADYLGLENVVAFSLGDLHSFDMRVNTLSETFLSNLPDKEIRSSCLLYHIIVKIGEYQSRAPQLVGMTRNEKIRKITPVVELMKTNFGDDLGLDELAKAINVTPNHLCRLFNQVYNTTPLKYLVHIRLNMAKQFLTSPKNHKIKDIAKRTGFHDPSYFCSVFKKSEGMTPEEFRKLNAF